MRLTHLSVALPPWILQLEAPDPILDRTMARVRQNSPDFLVVTLDGRRMRERASLFEQFALLLSFPDYFGSTWNSFADCIQDLTWFRAKGFVVAIREAQVLLEDGDPVEFGLFLRTAQETGASFREEQLLHPSVPFHLLLQAAPAHGGQLAKKIGQTGVPTSVLMEGQR